MFWFFVGAIGFMVGISLTAYLFQGQSDGMVLIVGFLAGVLGSLMAVLLQRMAVFVGGFLAGAFVVVNLVRLINIPVGDWNWIVVLAGGILGAIGISRAFDWAVILLSIFTGSLMIIQTMDLQPVITSILFLCLVLVGLYFQNRALKEEQLRGLH